LKKTYCVEAAKAIEAPLAAGRRGNAYGGRYRREGGSRTFWHKVKQ
jgi:hypothetical protein